MSLVSKISVLSPKLQIDCHTKNFWRIWILFMSKLFLNFTMFFCGIKLLATLLIKFSQHLRFIMHNTSNKFLEKIYHLHFSSSLCFQNYSSIPVKYGLHSVCIKVCICFNFSKQNPNSPEIFRMAIDL